MSQLDKLGAPRRTLRRLVEPSESRALRGGDKTSGRIRRALSHAPLSPDNPGELPSPGYPCRTGPMATERS